MGGGKSANSRFFSFALSAFAFFRALFSSRFRALFLASRSRARKKRRRPPLLASSLCHRLPHCPAALLDAKGGQSSELLIPKLIFRLYRPIFFMDFKTLTFALSLQNENLEAIQSLCRIKRYCLCESIALKVRNPQYQPIQSLVSVEICLYNRKLSIGIGICTIL